MCGIIAYYGPKPVENITNGLKNLSYRGYDSWGFVLSNGVKYHGISNKILQPFEQETCWALGQTRWATHGKINLLNAQPFNQNGFTLCHNGIIENIDEIYPSRDKKDSDTKTLFLSIYDLKIDLIIQCLLSCKGDNAFIFEYKNQVYVVITGNKILYKYKNIITSDLCNIQVPPHIRDKDLLILDNRQYSYVFDIPKEYISIKCIQEEDTMLSEIFEQSDINKQPISFFDDKKSKKLLFGCGSSYNAALFLSYQDPKIEACHASELKFKLEKYKDYKFLAISQSGETKDVIDIVETLLEKDYNVRGLTNSQDSILERLISCDFMYAGPEYAVAATKTFTHTILSNIIISQTTDIETLSKCVKKFVDDNNFRNYIFLGEGIFYPLALEAALKLKEVAQVWTDAMPASEIKHGPISCVDKSTLVVFLGKIKTRAILSNIEQVKSRGATVINFYDLLEYSHSLVDVFGPQLLAYWTAIKLGLNPNKPRGICKAVTV